MISVKGRKVPRANAPTERSPSNGPGSRLLRNKTGPIWISNEIVAPEIKNSEKLSARGVQHQQAVSGAHICLQQIGYGVLFWSSVLQALYRTGQASLSTMRIWCMAILMCGTDYAPNEKFKSEIVQMWFAFQIWKGSLSPSVIGMASAFECWIWMNNADYS